MDQAALLESLELARRHAASGMVQIERQETIINRLDAMGADTCEAQRLLRTFNEIQGTRLAYIQWMTARLGEMKEEQSRH